jgi:lysophospholipase L1-like esterase
MRAVSDQKDAAVIDSNAVLSGNSELFTDRIHFSPAGFATVISAMAECLEPIVDRPAQRNTPAA